jgi:hypothetical protein
MKRILFAFFCGLPLACAVPVPPTGGPADATPPSIVRSVPENGMTLFSSRDLVFEFDEAVDLRSFTSAFSISPDLTGIPEISGSGRRIRVRLPEDPRAETTYIVSLEATLRDVHNITLERPITIAFSTGESIDAAKMKGRVVRSLDGNPVAGIDVFAFANDDSSSTAGKPLYRTQTGKAGEFVFEHVVARAYYVVAIQDRNRNRLLDPGEPFGVPPVHYLTADTVAVAPKFPWIVATRDTTPPTLERVRHVSPRDLELRFSELLSLKLNDQPFSEQHNLGQIAVFDSLDTLASDLELYFLEDNPRAIFARGDSLPEGSYSIRGSVAVTDSSLNVATNISAPFIVSTEALPSKTASFLGWMPDTAVVSITIPRTIWPTETFGFRTTAPVDSVFSATIRDTTGTIYPALFKRVESTFFAFQKSSSFSFNQPFFLDINQKDFGGQDSVITGFFQYATERKLGSLSFVAERQPGADRLNFIVEGMDSANQAKRIFRVVERVKNTIVIKEIPGGTRAFLRVFQSAQNNWFSGELSPWSPAEPIAWIKVNDPIRARWETALPDTVKFGEWPLPPPRQ